MDHSRGDADNLESGGRVTNFEFSDIKSPLLHLDTFDPDELISLKAEYNIAAALGNLSFEDAIRHVIKGANSRQASSSSNPTDWIFDQPTDHNNLIHPSKNEELMRGFSNGYSVVEVVNKDSKIENVEGDGVFSLTLNGQKLYNLSVDAAENFETNLCRLFEAAKQSQEWRNTYRLNNIIRNIVEHSLYAIMMKKLYGKYKNPAKTGYIRLDTWYSNIEKCQDEDKDLAHCSSMFIVTSSRDFLDFLGQLYEEGVDLHWSALQRPFNKNKKHFSWKNISFKNVDFTAPVTFNANDERIVLQVTSTTNTEAIDVKCTATKYVHEILQQDNSSSEGNLSADSRFVKANEFYETMAKYVVYSYRRGSGDNKHMLVPYHIDILTISEEAMTVGSEIVAEFDYAVGTTREHKGFSQHRNVHSQTDELRQNFGGGPVAEGMPPSMNAPYYNENHVEKKNVKQTSLNLSLNFLVFPKVRPKKWILNSVFSSNVFMDAWKMQV
uniref:Uncharacterized protein n=1 Tax=Parascaris equorum TaxID=6256 RepID=A0A914S868_PAREQ